MDAWSLLLKKICQFQVGAMGVAGSPDGKHPAGNAPADEAVSIRVDARTRAASSLNMAAPWRRGRAPPYTTRPARCHPAGAVWLLRGVTIATRWVRHAGLRHRDL